MKLANGLSAGGEELCGGGTKLANAGWENGLSAGGEEAAGWSVRRRCLDMFAAERAVALN